MGWGKFTPPPKLFFITFFLTCAREPIFFMWTNFCVKMVFDTFSRFSSIIHPSQILKLQNWPFFMHNFLVLYLFLFLYYCFYIANLEISEVYLLWKWDSNTLLYKMCHVMLLWRHNWPVMVSFFVLAISQIPVWTSRQKCRYLF